MQGRGLRRLPEGELSSELEISHSPRQWSDNQTCLAHALQWLHTHQRKQAHQSTRLTKEQRHVFFTIAILGIHPLASDRRTEL